MDKNDDLKNIMKDIEKIKTPASDEIWSERVVGKEDFKNLLETISEFEEVNQVSRGTLNHELFVKVEKISDDLISYLNKNRVDIKALSFRDNEVELDLLLSKFYNGSDKKSKDFVLDDFVLEYLKEELELYLSIEKVEMKERNNTNNSVNILINYNDLFNTTHQISYPNSFNLYVNNIELGNSEIEIRLELTEELSYYDLLKYCQAKRIDFERLYVWKEFPLNYKGETIKFERNFNGFEKLEDRDLYKMKIDNHVKVKDDFIKIEGLPKRCLLNMECLLEVREYDGKFLPFYNFPYYDWTDLEFLDMYSEEHREHLINIVNKLKLDVKTELDEIDIN